MALADCLEFRGTLGSDGTKTLADQLKQTTEALLRVRSEAGLWYQVLDHGSSDPDGEGGNYEEASASLMIAYALMKGQRLGVLPASAGEQGLQSLQAAVLRFLSPERLDGICGVAGLGNKPYRDGSFAYYMSEPIVANDPKGVSALLMAVAEALLRKSS
jgi:unsaturated rhamnogalacturonyl hydrolase